MRSTDTGRHVTDPNRAPRQSAPWRWFFGLPLLLALIAACAGPATKATTLRPAETQAPSEEPDPYAIYTLALEEERLGQRPETRLSPASSFDVAAETLLFATVRSQLSHSLPGMPAVRAETVDAFLRANEETLRLQQRFRTRSPVQLHEWPRAVEDLTTDTLDGMTDDELQELLGSMLTAGPVVIPEMIRLSRVGFAPSGDQALVCRQESRGVYLISYLRGRDGWLLQDFVELFATESGR